MFSCYFCAIVPVSLSVSCIRCWILEMDLPMDLNHVRGFAVYGNRPAIPESYSRLYSQAGSMPGTSQSRSTAHIPPSANARRYPPKPKATPKPKSVPKSKAKRGRKSYAAAQKEKQKDNILVSGPKMFIYCSGISFYSILCNYS